MRCRKAVPRAGRRVGNQVLCPSCANRALRLENPAPKPTGQKTCVSCGRSRIPAASDDRGKPICKKCLTPEGALEAKASVADYWVARHARVSKLLSESFESSNSRKTFLQFSDWLAHKTPQPQAALALNKFANELAEIEKRLLDPLTATRSQFLEHFTAKEVRRHESWFNFFESAGANLPSRAEFQTASEYRRIDELIENADQQHKQWLTPYYSWLTDLDRPLSIRTVRGYISTAASSLKALGSPNNWATLEPYLSVSPGQANSLSRFITYLASVGLNTSSWRQDIEKHKNHKSRPIQRNDPLPGLIQKMEQTNDFAQLRAITAGVLVGIWGLDLEDVISLRRRDVSSAGGTVLALRIKGQQASCPDILIKDLNKYLQHIDGVIDSLDAPLFPGRPMSRPASAMTIANKLKELGFSVSSLKTHAKNAIVERSHN